MSRENFNRYYREFSQILHELVVATRQQPDEALLSPPPPLPDHANEK